MNLTGTLIDDLYEMQDLFAEGGMSYLYRAYDRVRGISVAIKVFDPSTVSNRIEDVIRYQGVIEKISSAAHPNIIGIIGSGSLARAFGPPLHYIVMELLPAGNLLNILNAGRSFSPGEAAEITLQTCRGLDAAHRLGVIHGDIKPENILLDEGGENINVKLIDFGLSHIKKPVESAYSREASGTFCYMPPEQAGSSARKRSGS